MCRMTGARLLLFHYMYKGKGSQQECKNDRGISLLSVVGKLHAKVLNNRAVRVTDD